MHRWRRKRGADARKREVGAAPLLQQCIVFCSIGWQKCLTREDFGMPSVDQFHARHERLFWFFIAVAAVVIALLFSSSAGGL